MGKNRIYDFLWHLNYYWLEFQFSFIFFSLFHVFHLGLYACLQ